MEPGFMNSAHKFGGPDGSVPNAAGHLVRLALLWNALLC